MNKIVLTCLITVAFTSTFAATTASAQAAQNQRERTTLYVDVTVRQHEIIAGPYARYAQKYLGISAPLADKVLHEVTSAKILETSDIQHHDEIIVNAVTSHMNPEKGFPRLTIDKTSATAMSLEESARLAAEKVFEIRRSRLDLITGEVGENVFGGGLDSALKELSRLEEEYLSLFLGKETSRLDFKQYSVTPVKSRSTYTVCRFSETDGPLPEDDLSGVPMVLELQLAGDADSTETANTQVRPSSRAVPHLIPADVRCRIVLDGVELASEQFQIPQLGEIVYINQ